MRLTGQSLGDHFNMLAILFFAVYGDRTHNRKYLQLFRLFSTYFSQAGGERTEDQYEPRPPVLGGPGY